MEKLSIFVETVLFDLANDLPSRIRDTGYMLNIVDELNRSNQFLSSSATREETRTFTFW